jgi:cytochrome c553
MEQRKSSPNAFLLLVVVAIGAVAGGAGVQYWLGTRGTAPAAAQAAPTPGAKPAGDLAADVARLKDLVPSQSHTMSDVGYHWAGLWFAAEKKNWPLARFFYDEARQHVRWTIAIRPVRKGPDGKDVNIKGIYDAIEPSAFATVQLAIEDEKTPEFEDAYKQALEACYSCHKAVGKPYLRPMIPTVPPQTVINYDPTAKWPE